MAETGGTNAGGILKDVATESWPVAPEFSGASFRMAVAKVVIWRSKHGNRPKGMDRMETFAIPGVGAIVERRHLGVTSILLQERWKEDAPAERGMLEIPAGKIRACESVFDCLRREVREETGLEIDHIEGENLSCVAEVNGYRALNYTPFSCSQNLRSEYPIMVQAFICTVFEGTPRKSEEARGFRWIQLRELALMIDERSDEFYPMHLDTHRKYLKARSL